MEIRGAVLRRVQMDLKDVFATSYDAKTKKDAVIVELITADGQSGFGECAASPAPLYTEETNETAWHMLVDHFLPALAGHSFASTDDLMTIHGMLGRFKGNRMAKAALEMAVWDAFSATSRVPLTDLLGVTRSEVVCGVSIGIQPDIRTLLQKVADYLEQGFQRIKIKVMPGWDVEPLRAIRSAFGNVALAADANSAYSLQDVAHLLRLDEFGLTMIEQPFAEDDLLGHAELQRRLSTPVCLDESIRSADDVRRAVALGACRVVNLKPGRVGGFAESLAIHRVCRELQVPLWCGGMLEMGIGRLHALFLAGLPGCTLPADLGPSDRYFARDLVHPPVTFCRPGHLPVHPLCGVAHRVDRERMAAATVRIQELCW